MHLTTVVVVVIDGVTAAAAVVVCCCEVGCVINSLFVISVWNSGEAALVPAGFVVVDFDGDTNESVQASVEEVGVRSTVEGRLEMGFRDGLVAAEEGKRVAVPMPVAAAVDAMVGVEAVTGVETGEDNVEDDASDSPLDDRVM